MLKPLSRTAGEGAGRSEAGEGSREQPSPSRPCGPGPSLSRGAGEGLPRSPMLMVRAGFGVEGRLPASDPSAEADHHFTNDVIDPDPQSRASDL